MAQSLLSTVSQCLKNDLKSLFESIMQFEQNILGKAVTKMKTKDKDNDDVVLESDKAI